MILLLENYMHIRSDSITYPLAQVSHLSLQHISWIIKNTIITPIHETKDPMMINDYRPISLLSGSAKILERLMHNRLLQFINKYQNFNKHQIGFRDNHSIFMALVILKNFVNDIDNGKRAVGKFIDFQKAFDIVEVGILPGKLYICGICGEALDWFCSPFCIIVNNYLITEDLNQTLRE